MNKHKQTWHIHIKGVVQGVGYRPLVYTKAKQYGLNGFVTNGTDGLHIEVNCDEDFVNKFVQYISISACPPLAQIVSTNIYKVQFYDYQDFTIKLYESKSDEVEISITPDFALCKNCRNELLDPENRRSNYEFITCTNCGPRYSIINALPYDRIHTEMQHFEMCLSCQSEYSNPENRRYYSQTNSCPECGIRLSLFNNKKECISQDHEAIHELIIKAWQTGRVIAIKSIGGYLLTCNTTNTQAISSLRSWKKRAKKPFALMYPDLKSLQDFDLKREEITALKSSTSPIVLVSRKDNTPFHFKGICDGFDRVGVMLPYNPLFQILLNQYKGPIVATSANISNSPIIFKNEIAINDLSQLADYILTNNRDIVTPQDDSVVTFTQKRNQKIIIRRSRGLAPNCINKDLKITLNNTLAMGADMKSVFGIFKNDSAHLSQLLGNLSDYNTEVIYRATLQYYLQLVSVNPQLILLDDHPNYISRRIGLEYAKKMNISTISIQHHHAHFCALLGEHNLLHTEEKILGVIWDGSGFGNDGNIWGGEFFTYEQHEFSRSAHLSYSKHLGNDKMSREPRLSAFALLGNSAYSAVQLEDKFSSTEWNVYTSLQGKENGILTSSMGRLFDAVASILGICDLQEYQGEAAHLLEVKARAFFKSTEYRLDIGSYLDAESTSLHPQDVLEKIIRDLAIDLTIEQIAAKFHITLVHWINSIAIAQSCKKIGFSGGVFQNSLLVDLIIITLEEAFELLLHNDLPPNDENIAFGQMIYASIRK